MIVLWEDKEIRKTAVEIIQINLGNRCNQQCYHCHIGASPTGDKNMNEETAECVFKKLTDFSPQLVEFTGGAPEMNHNLKMFIKELSKYKIRIAVRTNLTVLDMPEYSEFIDLYKRYKVKVIASLPGCFKDVTDRQRGKGVFDRSISVLKKLNKVGYGTNNLELDLVHNPSDNYLPPSIEQLEHDYKQILQQEYGIIFNKLITITNSPIGGFKRYLINNKKYEDYLKLLVNNFNSDTLDHLMCKRLVSVDYLGYIYDCDFNLALGIKTKGYENIKFWEIDFNNFNPEISCGEHCYACTAAHGSSCHGKLIENNKDFNPINIVQRYYGTELKGTSDLKAGACCSPDSYPPHIREALSYVADEIKQKYYGCGSPIPLVLEGLRVLDIGCGTGRDCYVLSKLVGEHGFVYGIDMTKEQIDIAIKYINTHTELYGYKKPNVKFIHDYIENLEKYFPANLLDLVVSNCVINLIEDKENVIKQVYRILKNGGEFYFSDIYADRRLPEEIKRNPLLYGECLGGALYWKDFERLARKVGFMDPRIVSKKIININNEEIQRLIGNITFYSITYRLWKIPELEDACEDFGHITIYKGGISESPFRFILDASHIFEKDKPERICGNTALMLSKTRLGDYFEIIGTFDQHFGLFENCNTTPSYSIENIFSNKYQCC